MKSFPGISCVNGKYNNFIPAADRGLAYGDGLFETILVVDGKLVLENDHLSRLFRDAVRLKINLNHELLSKELEQVVRHILDTCLNKTGVLKIIITRQSNGRGYGFDKASGSSRFLQYYPDITYPSANRDGVRIGLTDHCLPDNKILAGIKHLNRLDQVFLYTKIRKPFYQELITCGARGEILECSFSNLFIVKDGVVYTAIVNKAGVQGVMRDYIFNHVCPSLKLTSIETVISLDQLLQADEVFICNSIFGVWPVNAVDVKSYAVGQITLAIQKQVDRLGYPALYS